MKRAKRVSILIGVVLAVSFVSQASGASSSDDKILEFDTLVGVSGPFVGASNPIRGVDGGGLPWQIDEGKGELRAGAFIAATCHVRLPLVTARSERINIDAPVTIGDFVHLEAVVAETCHTSLVVEASAEANSRSVELPGRARVRVS